MLFTIVVFSLLNSERFVTSTFSRTEILTISLTFAMNVMVLPYVLNREQISRSLQLRVPIELLAIFHAAKLLVCLKRALNEKTCCL